MPRSVGGALSLVPVGSQGGVGEVDAFDPIGFGAFAASEEVGVPALPVCTA